MGGSFANLYGTSDYKVWEFPHLAKFYVDAEENRIDTPIFMLPHYVNLKIQGHDNNAVMPLCILSEGGNSVFGVFNNAADGESTVTNTVNNLYFSTRVHQNSANVLFFLKPADDGTTKVYAENFCGRSANTKVKKNFKKLDADMKFNLFESNPIECFLNEEIPGVGFDLMCDTLNINSTDHLHLLQPANQAKFMNNWPNNQVYPTIGLLANQVNFRTNYVNIDDMLNLTDLIWNQLYSDDNTENFKTFTTEVTDYSETLGYLHRDLVTSDSIIDHFVMEVKGQLK